MLTELDRLGGDVKRTVDKALKRAGDKIAADTLTAIDSANLPAKGVYSKGDTRESVITEPQVTWDGNVASIPVGFDFSKPGAGGYLISGTPRMRPDMALQKMYRQKKYMAEIQNEISDAVMQEIMNLNTGGAE